MLVTTPTQELNTFVWMIVQNVTYVNNLGVSAVGCGLMKVFCDDHKKIKETFEKIYNTCKDAITHIRIWQKEQQHTRN